MKIVGYKKSDFTSKDGKQITGYNVYLARDIDPRKGNGVEVERCYLSDTKIAREGIDLAGLLDSDVKIYYNRFGKVDSIVTVEGD